MVRRLDRGLAPEWRVRPGGSGPPPFGVTRTRHCPPSAVDLLREVGGQVASKRTREPARRRPAGGPKGAGGDGATRTKASTRAQREALLQAQARRERRARILRIGIPLLVVA